MLNTKKSALGTLTRSRTALAVIAATLLVGGSVTEASAKSRHHHYRHHHHHHDRPSDAGGDLARRQCLDGAVLGTGRSFSGMASYLRQ